AAALVVAPIAIRNHQVSGEWIPLSWQGGINLYLGNHPGADGVSATLPGFTSWRNEDVEALLTRELGHRPGPREQDRHFRALALEYLRDSPGDFARGLLRKTALFFQSYEIRNNRDLYWLRDRTGWLRGPWPDWGWIVPLALVGLVVGGRARPWRPLLPTLAYAAALAASPILFFVCARYRIPAWPAFLVLAGAGGAAIVEPGVRLPRRLAALAAVIALAVVARLDPFGVRDPDVAPVHFQYANVLARVGEDGEAEREYREALALTPGYPEARYHLGALLLRQGRVGEAFPELDAAVRAMPSSFRARRSLAEAWETAGRPDQAIPLRREIVALTGGALEDRFQLATALGLAGRYEESLAEFRALDDTPLRDDSDFLLNAGQTALALGREDLGLEWLERALDRPDAREFAADAIARYWLSRENWDAGLRVLSNGLLRAPDSEPLLRLRAHARRATGDATGAIEDWEHVLRLAPGDSVATEELAGLREHAGP
ncbi:MAG: tetratricopeptide repeat protein, partial [Gemmatimonadetes bacterium]|nr:tetratricopeptide repeat protein [Gemmatimonadota bacterium]